MSTSPASSSSTAVPSKGASPREGRQRELAHPAAAESPSESDNSSVSGSRQRQPPLADSVDPSLGQQPALRVAIPSNPSSSASLSGLVSAAGAASPFTFTVSATAPDLSSPHELVPLSSSFSSSSSVSGLTTAFSHVDVDYNLAGRSASPNVAQDVFHPPPQPGVNAPPKTNTHSKPAPQGHVPRPRNPYILYRMDVVARGLIQGEKKHQNISKVVSEMWNALETQEKAPYVAAAHLEKMEHKRLYPNYIYHPGTDRPKPTRAPRVHKGSKAAGSKAAAAAKKAASKKGKDRQDDDQLRAAEELERAADDDDDDDGDYQPTKKRSTSSQKSRGSKIRPPRPSSSRQSSSFSSQGESSSRTDENQGGQEEYEQSGRKRRSNREPFGSADGTGSPALSGRSVASEASSDFQGSSASSSFDDERIERMRMQQGFHVSYLAASAPRPEHAHGQPAGYLPHPGPYDQPMHSVRSSQYSTLPPGSQLPPASPPQFYYAPYADYSMPPDARYAPDYHPHGPPGRMAPPGFPSPPPTSRPPVQDQPSGLPGFRTHDYQQQFLPTAEPSPITPGFPDLTQHRRRGSSFSALGPRPPRRESAGFGLGFQEEETPRTAAFREAFLLRSPAYPPALPLHDEQPPASAASSSTPTTSTFPPAPAAGRPTSDTTAQRRKSRNAGPLTELFTREALRPQTFPRATTESSVRQSWHMGEHEMFVELPAADAPQPIAGPSSHARQQQQQHQPVPATRHFAQPIQRSGDMPVPPTYGELGLDMSSRRKGRPEPLAFVQPPSAGPQQPFFRSLPADGLGGGGAYGQPMDEVTPTQATFAEYCRATPPNGHPSSALPPSLHFSPKTPVWAFDPTGDVGGGSGGGAQDPAGPQHYP